MLVLCVGMYRACSTWQYGVVGAILEKHRNSRRLGFVTGIYFPEKVDLDQSTTDWLMLKAHDAHDQFAKVLSAGEAIGIYSYRDLQDVVFSFMHVAGTDFDTLMEWGFVELCLNNDRFWRAQPGMLIQAYDDLIADPVRGVQQIADHLGVVLIAGEAESIAEAMSWESNRRKVDSMADRLRTEGTTLRPDDESIIDPVSLLHWNHIRSTNSTGAEQPGTTRQRRLIEQSRRSWSRAHDCELPEAVPSVSTVEVEPVVRMSYAPSGVDIRLDRLFRGVKATLVDFDAPLPRVANPSYYFYLRGWRSVNVGTTSSLRDDFVVQRPSDLNLARRSPTASDTFARPGIADRFASETLADLVAEDRLPPPELVIFNPASDVDRLVGAILSTSWRPKVFVVDLLGTVPEAPGWRSRLEQAGYLAVPVSDGPKLHVRADLADAITTLARPLGPDDHYRPAEWTVADPAALEAGETWVPPSYEAPTAGDPETPRTEPNLAGLRSTIAERDRWKKLANAERRRSRTVSVGQRRLQEQVATLGDQVATLNHRIVEVEESLAEIRRSIPTPERNPERWFGKTVRRLRVLAGRCDPKKQGLSPPTNPPLKPSRAGQYRTDASHQA